MTRWKAVVREAGLDPKPFGRNAESAMAAAAQILRGKETKPRRMHHPRKAA